MAENLERTIDKGCEEFFDFNCSICLSKSNACTEAAYYCPECKAYFCKPCMGRCECKHSVMGRGSVDKWGVSITPELFDRCPRHVKNEVQLYCTHHDVVCCPICSQTDHKKCDDLKFIPLVASGEMNRTNDVAVKKEIKSLKTWVKELRDNRSPRLETVNDTSSNMVKQVKDNRAKIDALLNAQEETSIGQIQKWQTDLTDRIKSELNICDSIEEGLAELEGKISNSLSNEPLLFARLKQGRVFVSENKGLVSDMLGTSLIDDAQFRVYTDTLNTLKSHKGLGQLMPRDAAEESQTDGHGYAQQKPKLDSPYKVNSISSVDVAMKGDGTSNIWSMCQMSDGRIILADSANKCLKRLDNTYKVTDRCILPCKPTGVCRTLPDELAVTLANKTVQYVSMGKNMALSRSFSTNIDCSGLAFVNGNIYVTQYRGSKVVVYDRTGVELRTIHSDKSGKQLFSNTKYITPDPEGKILLVTDWDKGLITLEINGTFLTRLNCPELQNACDVCIDKAGNVFVCGFFSHSIIQVNHNGDQKLANLANVTDANIWCPQALCFDGVSSCLLVASLNSNLLKILHMSQ